MDKNGVIRQIKYIICKFKHNYSVLDKAFL